MRPQNSIPDFLKRLLPICDDMIKKTKILLSLWDPGLVEEALNFIEEHKLIVSDICGTGDEYGLDTGGKPMLMLSPFKRITQQLTTLDLKSPDLDDFATPCTPKNFEDIWNISSSQSLSRADSSLLNTSEGVRVLYSNVATLDELNFIIFPDCEDNPSETIYSSNSSSSDKTSNDDKHRFLDPESGKMFLDTHVMCNSPSANYYKPTDEPEPWDLTQLNIEASVMCLVSKVKFLCGRCGSPAVRLRQNQKFVKESVITSQPTAADDNECSRKSDVVSRAVNSVSRAIRNGNKFTDGLDLNKIVDWAAELRPALEKPLHPTLLRTLEMNVEPSLDKLVHTMYNTWRRPWL